jgi:hypothetical protein
MSKHLKIGTLIKMHSDESVGVITGTWAGDRKYAVYTIRWLTNNGDHPNFYQAHVFEVIG